MDTEQRRQSDNHETCDLHKNRLNLNLGNHLTPDSRCVVLLIMTLASTFNCLYQCVYWLGAFSPIYAGSATFKLSELWVGCVVEVIEPESGGIKVVF